MSDLRERIIKEIRDYDDTDTYSTLADAVLAVVTAHMAVTDADMFACLRVWKDAIWQDVGEREGIRSVLESFVTRKLKAETR